MNELPSPLAVKKTQNMDLGNKYRECFMTQYWDRPMATSVSIIIVTGTRKQMECMTHSFLNLSCHNTRVLPSTFFNRSFEKFCPCSKASAPQRNLKPCGLFVLWVVINCL